LHEDRILDDLQKKTKKCLHVIWAPFSQIKARWAPFFSNQSMLGADFACIFGSLPRFLLILPGFLEVLPGFSPNQTFGDVLRQ